MDIKALLKTKTFWAAIGGAVTICGCAASGVVVDGHQITWMEAIQTSFAAIVAVFLRDGIQKSGPNPPAAMLLVCILGASTMTGCVGKRYGATLFPRPAISVDTSKYAAQMALVPDEDPDAVAIETTYRSKTSELPDVSFSLDRPSTDTIKCLTRAKLSKNATPVEPPGSVATGTAIKTYQREK